ncbi:MAG: hypothetical protein C0467_00195 [Planctomycetaceae bacterium]|nr:hypothetical protein [Planctomycetaceae bacterium]
MHGAYTLVFLVLACAFCFAASWSVGWPALLFAYTAISFSLVALAYAGVGPLLFCKRASGQQTALSWLLFCPYFLVNSLIFQLHLLASREQAWAEVIPNLFFGRRLSNHEASTIMDHGWVAVFDLAPEFGETPVLRSSPGYRSFPILDATAPSEAQFDDLLHRLSATLATGPVYVHCALGHGRTGCVVVAYLLSVGMARSVRDGVQLLQSLRPGVRLNRSQHRALRNFQLRLPNVG